MHQDLKHLSNNLISYLITIFIVFNIETNKEIFIKSAILILLLLPFVSSAFTLSLLPGLNSSRGFSAILSAFIGYLLVSATNFFDYKLNLGSKNNFLYMLFIANLLLTMVFSINAGFFFLISAFLLLIYLLYQNRLDFIEIFNYISMYVQKSNQIPVLQDTYNITVTLLLLILIFSLSVLIPLNIVSEGQVVDISAHYLGYIFGILIPILLNKIDKYLQFTY